MNATSNPSPRLTNLLPGRMHRISEITFAVKIACIFSWATAGKYARHDIEI